MAQTKTAPRLNSDQPVMPSEVSPEIGFFDRFAGGASALASRAPFFAGCVILVILWLTQGVVTIIVTGKPSKFLDAQYQLEINTTTTIITFLLVALLQNSQTREDQAIQHKLNAIADALGDLMDHVGGIDQALRDDIVELRDAVGLEQRESSSHNKHE